jgi:magnesium transporter
LGWGKKPPKTSGKDNPEKTKDKETEQNMSMLKTKFLDEAVKHCCHQDFVRLREDMTVEQAIRQLQQCDLSERIMYLYVLDTAERLVGVVPVRRLLGNTAETRIGDIMLKKTVTVSAETTMEQVGEVLLRHKLLAVPVVDEQQRLLGVVDLNHFTEDTLSVSRKSQLDSIFQLLGLHISLGRQVSAWTMFRERFPWLLWNITSGIFCALIASQYELLIREVVLLAMFMTVVLALGESVSMQAMTITVQRLAAGPFRWSSALSSLRRELAAAVLLAVGCATLVFATAMAWKGQWTQAAAVGISVVLSILTACVLGAMVPSLIKAVKVDPKLAAGPIALACTDVCTMLYYFQVMEMIAR